MSVMVAQAEWYVAAKVGKTTEWPESSGHSVALEILEARS